MKIIDKTKETAFNGCDFVVQLPEGRKGTPIKILQLTDIQVIDAAQRRTPDRIRADEIEAWSTENFDMQCGNHIKSLIAQSLPDMIFITGDIIYGSFDDSGRTFQWFCALMDSFEIPWAPVFGNHDNESAKGVAWQCEQFEKSKFCLFKKGDVSGNGNYTVGIAVGEELVRVLHMTDSNGCHDKNDDAVISEAGIYPDQLENIRKNTALIEQAQNKKIPAFMAFHIPVDGFKEAERAKGYRKSDDELYMIGVDRDGKDGDFGFCLEKYGTIKTEEDFITFAKAQSIDGVFVGHVHNSCTCISHEGIKWVFGLKTGQYDYHIPGQLGGTLITLNGDGFTVNHIPSLVRFAPMPKGAPMFKGLFAEGEK